MGLWGRSCIACTYVSVSVELWFGFFLPPRQKDNKPIQITHFVLSLRLLLSPSGEQRVPHWHHGAATLIPKQDQLRAGGRGSDPN